MEELKAKVNSLDGEGIYRMVERSDISSHTANRVIKALKSKKIFPESMENTFIRSGKQAKVSQLDIFTRCVENNLVLLRAEFCISLDVEALNAKKRLHLDAIDLCGGGDKDDEPSLISLQARLIHMLEPSSQSYALFCIIFGGDERLIQRAVLDDKDSRPAALWEELVSIFNSRDFEPRNEFLDMRVNSINPSIPPEEGWNTVKVLPITFHCIVDVN